MWNKRDWMLVGTSACAVCGLTLAGFYPGSLIAADAPPVLAAVEVPSYRAGDCTLTAAIAPKAAVLASQGGRSFIKAGALPALVVSIVNTGAAPTTIHFQLALNVTTTRDRLSRVPRATPPAWSEDYSLQLQPNETRKIAIAPKVEVAESSSVQLLARDIPVAPPANVAPAFGVPRGVSLVNLFVAAPPAQPAAAAAPSISVSPDNVGSVAGRLAVRRAQQLAQK